MDSRCLSPVPPPRRRCSRRAAVYALILVAAWRWRRYTASKIGSAEPWGPRWLALLVAEASSRLMGLIGAPMVRHHVAQPCERDRQYLVCWHPHAAYTTMALMHTATMTIRGDPLTWFTGVAPVLFSLPGLREALLLLNARSVDSSVVAHLAERGLNVGIQPGGVPEQLQADHTREIAVFPPKLGFIRLALRHGMDLLPAYIFGENQAYHTSEASRRTAQSIFRSTGVPLVPISGRWGLPWPVPRRVEVSVCWGRPVSVGPPDAEPSEQRVAEVFARYCAELRRLFDEHKDSCLPPEVAARGLSIVHRTAADEGPKSRL